MNQGRPNSARRPRPRGRARPTGRPAARGQRPTGRPATRPLARGQRPTGRPARGQRPTGRPKRPASGPQPKAKPPSERLRATADAADQFDDFPDPSGALPNVKPSRPITAADMVQEEDKAFEIRPNPNQSVSKTSEDDDDEEIGPIALPTSITTEEEQQNLMRRFNVEELPAGFHKETHGRVQVTRSGGAQEHERSTATNVAMVAAVVILVVGIGGLVLIKLFGGS